MAGELHERGRERPVAVGIRDPVRAHHENAASGELDGGEPKQEQ